ncbi:hypothetical protein JOB18_024551 [Solea senegalensis]|uniref:Uncharacterized protein n=1 Tax=Solea senegalensis TaxID=28829 RepID=A0AAV6RTM5_SOLSE|nr:hypothetical protein JOB18_024551 [Solea senegalensis]
MLLYHHESYFERDFPRNPVRNYARLDSVMETPIPRPRPPWQLLSDRSLPPSLFSSGSSSVSSTLQPGCRSRSAVLLQQMSEPAE